MELIQAPYIGEDRKLHVSHQPITFSSRRPWRTRKTPRFMTIPETGYIPPEMREMLESRQKLHEAELRRRNQQLSVPRRGSRNGDTEEKIRFITKSFVSLGGAVLGHLEELTMGELPEASQKTNFALLLREYSTTKSVMHGLTHKKTGHKQTSSYLALKQFDHWLIDLLQSFLNTSFGQSYAGLIPANDLLDTAQLPGPDPVFDYIEQTLQACLLYITNSAAGSKDIGELLSRHAILKAALPPNISSSIVHYIGALVNSVCDHILTRAAAIRPALELRHAH